MTKPYDPEKFTIKGLAPRPKLSYQQARFIVVVGQVRGTVRHLTTVRRVQWFRWTYSSDKMRRAASDLATCPTPGTEYAA